MAELFKYAILALSTGAMVLGVLIIAGVLVPRNFPDQYRIVMGIVVFLYGLYRFVVAFTRSPRRQA